MSDVDWDKLANFNKKEFTCRCGCGGNEMNERFMSILQEIRTKAGFPFVVSSGYRCPAYDKKLGGAGNHTTGHAVDIVASGAQAYEILCLSTPYMTGIGIHQKGPSRGRFLHLDNLVNEYRPTIWSYR